MGEGPALSGWLESARRLLVGDGYCGVCIALSHPLSDPEATAQLAASAGPALNYFAGHRDRLGYAARLHRGQVIGSGLVEGTIKERVNLCLKRTGARWRAERVGPFVELLALADAVQWDEYWKTLAARCPIREAHPLKIVLADFGYRRDALDAYLKDQGVRYRRELSSRPEGLGFVVIRQRWIVERTLSWLRSRRLLARDYERYEYSSLANAYMRSVVLTLNKYEAARIADDADPAASARTRPGLPELLRGFPDSMGLSSPCLQPQGQRVSNPLNYTAFGAIMPQNNQRSDRRLKCRRFEWLPQVDLLQALMAMRCRKCRQGKHLRYRRFSLASSRLSDRWHLMARVFETGVRLTKAAFGPIAARLERSELLPKWSLVIHPTSE